MVTNLKDLEKLLKLCRKQGVTEINLSGVAFKLGELPKHQTQEIQEEDLEARFTEELEAPMTVEELAMFANGGLPQDNPLSGAQ